MPRTSMCIQCSREFSSEAAFQAHKANGHDNSGTLITPPNVPPTSLPNPEFIEAVNRIEAEKNQPKPQPKDVAPDGSQLKLPDPKPIVLQYLYTGMCPVCRSEVDTVEVDVGENHFVIAHCAKCKKQLADKQAAKL